ncbi:MAG: HAD-IIA family hydrolase [Actinomycetota bacterium]|nr:HAD-IIA family hydrolase [Actinomycetota bacterium]
MIAAMVWILDLDGVVWLADTLIPGAAEAIAALRAAGHTVAFATNFSAGTIGEFDQKLRRFGIEPDGDVVTSAMAVATLVEPGERVLLCAGAGVREALAARNVEIVEDGPADAVVVGYHHTFDYERMRVASTAAREGARLLATNDDATYPSADGLLPGTGAILAGIERASGVKAVVAGKPYAPTVALIEQRYGREGTMVGDRPDTDGRLARALGYRWALVLTGVTTSLDPTPDPAPDLIAPSLAVLVDRELHV